MNFPKAALLSFLLPATVFAQEAIKPQPSPMAIVTARYKNTYMKITYCQPHKRGREIFGKLVPYGQVWRTGANEATEMTITQDIRLQGNLLKAGTYALFSIPNQDKWTLILNSDLGQWGAYNYNSKMDVLRVDTPLHYTPELIYEPFSIIIDQKNEKAEISLRWDNVKVSFPVEFLDPKP